MINKKAGLMSFSNYDFTPSAPIYLERKNRGGFIDFGKNNLYPNYLMSLVNRSPLHNAIVNLKSSMLGRNGFISANWSPETINFINNPNNELDLEEILAKISLDYVIFGGYCLNIRWSKDRSKIAEINYVSPLDVRIAVPATNVEEESYYISSDWTNIRNNVPVLYPAFSTINRAEASQILYYKEHRGSNNFYPVPEYLAGINMMETNYQINEFHLHGIMQQFSPSMHINFNYVPNSDEERDEIVRRLKMEYEGAKKSGNVIISFTEDSSKKPTIEPIQLNDSDKKFIELKKDVLDGIVSAHGLTDKKLLGLEISGELGGHKNELLESLSVFQAMYISAKQRSLEKVINMLGRVNGLTDKIVIKKYDTNLTPTISVGDMLAILQSTIDARQKVELLVNHGYSRDTAELLINTNTNPITVGPTTEQIK
jgi:hypothetical protein